MTAEAWTEEELAAARAAEASARARMTVGTSGEPKSIGGPVARALHAIRSLPPAPEFSPEDQAEADRQEVTRAARRREYAVRQAQCVLPERYQIDLDSPEIVKRVKRRAAIAESLAAVGAMQVVWMGASGAGKSTLACATARRWAEEHGGGRLVWTRASALATASRYHALGEGEPPAMVAAAKADLLVLDELGDTMRTAAWDDVAEILFRRYEDRRPTWVTTWLTPDKVAAQYGDGFARRVFEGTAIACCQDSFKALAR